MREFLEHVHKTIQKFDLLKKGDRIVIALSGGPDSVSLLHILGLIADDYELTLAAAHVNHQLRKDADTDQLFCKELCKAHGYKFYSRKVDIKKRAVRLKVGIEQAGRDYRYSYFQSICQKYGYNKIATGHTSDDSAETFLLNLIRGADLGGLSGIPAKRGNIIRPLIDIPKKELLHFLKEHNLSYRIDKSNFGFEYNRNLVRNKIIPAMAKINPGIAGHVARAARKVNEAYEVIDHDVSIAYAKCLVSKDRRQIILDLRKLPVYYKSLESWVLIKAYFQLAESLTRPGSNRIERVLGLSRNGSMAFLGEGVVVAFYNNMLILSKPTQRIRRIKLKRNKLNNLSVKGWQINAESLEKFDFSAVTGNKDESIAYLSDDQLQDFEVRCLQKGDRFKPLGLKGTKKLVDYLNDKNVPQLNKQSIPLVICKDKVAWVAGFGISDEFKVSRTTKRILKLQLINR